jgi:hypothetical protein
MKRNGSVFATLDKSDRKKVDDETHDMSRLYILQLLLPEPTALVLIFVM